MKTLMIAVLCFASGLAVQEEPERLRYDFEAPAFAADADGTIAMHFLPPSNGFSANVNLTVQPYDGTLEDYDKLSARQLKAMGLVMIDKSNKDDVLRYEYEGTQSGQKLRWYAKAFKANGKVYLATATARQDQWKEQSPGLIKSVESFALQEAE